MSNRPQKAREYFEKGYNCSQAVLLAFSDVTNLDEKTASRISSSFGGGMGRLREVCGALTGAFMAAVLSIGNTDVADSVAMAKHYVSIQLLGLAFKEKYGTFLCRELLELDILHDIPVSESRTPEYYRKRKCSMYVEYAAKLLDDYIIENGVKQ